MFFHWLIFALLVSQYAVGSIFPHIGRKTLDVSWVSCHFSIDTAILVTVEARFVWWQFSPVAPTIGLEPWQAVLSKFTHFALYTLVFAMTVLGWMATISRGWDVKRLGIITFPALVSNGSKLGHQAGDVHNILGYVLLGFILLHVAGALYHYFVKRDQVLQHMLFIR